MRRRRPPRDYEAAQHRPPWDFYEAACAAAGGDSRERRKRRSERPATLHFLAADGSRRWCGGHADQCFDLDALDESMEGDEESVAWSCCVSRSSRARRPPPGSSGERRRGDGRRVACGSAAQLVSMFIRNSRKKFAGGRRRDGEKHDFGIRFAHIVIQRRRGASHRVACFATDETNFHWWSLCAACAAT